MEKYITPSNLRDFAYCNDRICSRPIRGIVLNFFGLGGQDIYRQETDYGKFFASHGVLLVVPYNNPWAWMNRQAVSMTDEIMDTVMEMLDLPEDLPIVSSGGSMGGLSAITYCVYAKRTPVACVANCPVCDLPRHLHERKDLPRTLYSAFWNYEGTLEKALETVSPMHLGSRLPDIDYYLFHCQEDEAVNIHLNTEAFAAKMSGFRRVHVYRVPDRRHCDLSPEMWDRYKAHILEAISR